MVDLNSSVEQVTVTADEIRATIASYSRDGYDSPLLGKAQEIYDIGVQYNIDPAFFCAVAAFESAFGLSGLSGYPTSIWDPLTGTGTYNWASITNAYYGGDVVPGTRWGQYPDLDTGIEAFYKLIATEYLPNGQETIGAIIWGVGGSDQCSGSHGYGPTCGKVGSCYPCTDPGDNVENDPGYAQRVVDFMNGMVALNGPAPTPSPPQQPAPTPNPAPLPPVMFVPGSVGSDVGGLMIGIGLMTGAGLLLAYKGGTSR